MRTYPAEAPVAGLLLGPGAGAGEDHPWLIHTAQGLAGAGITVWTFNFSYMELHRRAPDRGPVLEETLRTIWAGLAAPSGLPLFAGGKSMGGRIATQVAAAPGLEPRPAGLVCFGYPLHPPGKPTVRRDRHLPKVPVPLLFLSGTRDPFASPDELQALGATLPGLTVQVFDGGDHSLETRRRGAAFGPLDQAIQAAAAWMQEIVSVRRTSAPPRP